MKKTLMAVAIATASLGALVACNEQNNTTTPVTGTIDAWLLSTTGELVGIDVDNPGRNITFSRISGLLAATSTTAEERIIDIDYRNADGSLYGLSDQSRIYLISPSSGTATLVSRLRNAADTADYTLSNAATYTIDFNPAADRLRIIGSNGDNLRVDVLTGQTIVDGNINGGGAIIAGAAYTDTFGASGRGTQLFTLDTVNDQLYLQNPPNAGTQTNAIPLGVNATAVQGYDIVPETGLGYAILSVGGAARLYQIDQTAVANAATLVSDRKLPGDITYRSLALVTRANPTVLGLSDDNKLYQFTANNPAVISTATSVTLPAGAPMGETLLGIDFRQSDRTLYGLSSAGRIYSINLTPPTAPATAPIVGAATLVSTLTADAADTSNPFTGLSAGSSTMDFNPTVPGTTTPASVFPDQNRLRIIGADLSNAVAVIDSGSVTTQSAVTPSTAAVAAAAYSNNFRGSTSTQLFVIDRTTNSVAVQLLAASGAVPEGTLTTLGTLGITVNGRAGFDISGRANENVLLAARSTATGPLTLYRLVLASGSNLATAVDQVGGAAGPGNLVDIAIRY